MTSFYENVTEVTNISTNILVKDLMNIHPLVSFHREVLFTFSWSVIRNSFYNRFLKTLEAASKKGIFDNENGESSGLNISEIIGESRKFWRHCKEMLGKWILSQASRVSGRETSDCCLNYFTDQKGRELFLSGKFYGLLDIINENNLSTYDEQLIRDLVMKCALRFRKNKKLHELVRTFIQKDFKLSSVCIQISKWINTWIFNYSSSIIETSRNDSFLEFCERTMGEKLLSLLCEDEISLETNNMRPNRKREREAERTKGNCTLPFIYVPVIEILREGDSRRTSSQKRIMGSIVVVSIKHLNLASGELSLTGADNLPVPRALMEVLIEQLFGEGSTMSLSTLYDKRFPFGVSVPASIPIVAMQKLFVEYNYFGKNCDEHMFTPEHSVVHQFFVLRASTLALRYESNLSSGSLQLCADINLKNMLYNRNSNNEEHSHVVVDLCASPINAYFPEFDRCNEAERVLLMRLKKSVSGNHFCSAFPDTDIFFGSLGNASALNIKNFIEYNDNRLNSMPTKSLYCFTLDVPYDEDLCNLLFTKMAQDCLEFEKLGRDLQRRVAFILVLPLWWDLRWNNVKKFRFESGEHCEGATSPIDQAVSSAVSYLNDGYVVHYNWTSILTGKEKCPESAIAASWCCFDAMFVNKNYTYFCASTNKPLTGVTATEVLVFESPAGLRPFRSVVSEFYDSIGKTE